MKQKTQISLGVDGFLVLLKGTLGSIPFNVLSAGILALDFIYNQVSVWPVLFWFGSIFFLSIWRWIYNQVVLVKKYYQTHFELTRLLFLCFAFLTGLAWGVVFFIFSPVVNSAQQAIIGSFPFKGAALITHRAP
ncbi:MAG: hypothetical protein ACRCXC_04335 [Legionella sp.]